jgi:hypothetical protein
LAAAWGRAVIHVFDQGFASAFWLGLRLSYSLRFVLRWRKDYQLLDAAGNRRLTWKIAQGKRGWSQRTVWDARRASFRGGDCPGAAGGSSGASRTTIVAGGLSQSGSLPLVFARLLKPSKPMSRPGKSSLPICVGGRSN